MSDGFFYWYRSGWGHDEAVRILRTADSCGLLLTNPKTSRASLITNGPESWGEQVLVAESELIEEAALPDGREEANFQLWLDAACDVFTRVRRIDGGGVVLEFGLDGLTADETERATASLVRALDTQRTGTLGFVIDRLGVSEELDWDSVLTGQSIPVDPLPDTFGLRAEYVGAHPELAACVPVEYGDLAVYNASREEEKNSR